MDSAWNPEEQRIDFFAIIGVCFFKIDLKIRLDIISCILSQNIIFSEKFSRMISLCALANQYRRDFPPSNEKSIPIF